MAIADISLSIYNKCARGKIAHVNNLCNYVGEHAFFARKRERVNKIEEH